LIGLTWRRTLKHTKSRSRWYIGDSAMARWHVDGNAMVRWWKHNGTNVKQRLYDGETQKARWWKRDGTMVKDDVTMVKIRWYDMMKLRWHDDENAILFSLSCHRIIVILTLCHRVLIIVPSQFHLCTIVHSCSGRQKCYLCPNGTPLSVDIEWYNIVTRIASCRNLASRFASRSWTRDTKFIPE
jgi:hypothetical protein